jgi:hypothetical protein
MIDKHSHLKIQHCHAELVSVSQNINFEQYLGIKWSATGENTQDGFNCWTFVRFLYQQHLQIDLPTFDVNAMKLKDCVIKTKAQMPKYTQVRIANIWDISLMSRRVEPSHVGVYIDKQHIMHCVERQGVIITNKHQLENQGFKELGVYRWQ